MIQSSAGNVPTGSPFLDRQWIVRGNGARGNQLIITSTPGNTTILRSKQRPYSKTADFAYL
jgi:hypothetical protein